MWWLAVGAGGGQKNPPTSHRDSLGAVDGSGCRGGQKDRPTSRGDSLGVVVGSRREGGGMQPPNESW